MVLFKIINICIQFYRLLRFFNLITLFNIFYRIRRDFFLQLLRIVTPALHNHHNISFLVFLTFWMYFNRITNFQVMGRYFPFSKNILSFFKSSSPVSGLGPIKKYLLRDRSRSIVWSLGLLL